jgi:peptidoglycan/xylan/chitin deacetylase (PgdA/CDA1 family)
LTANPLRHPPVLIYHSVAELAADDSGRSGKDLFERQMEYLARSGYRTLTPDEFISAMKLGRWPVKSLLITFDDGYGDFYEHAVPSLRKYGFSAVVFLIADVVDGGLDAWAGPRPHAVPPSMTWSQVEELQQERVFFGSHGKSHHLLTQLDAAQLAEEVVGSKKELESKLGVEVSMFAYPYGDCSEETKAAVKAAGYEVAFGLNFGDPDRFEIPRRAVPPARTVVPFALRVSAAYPLLRRAARLVRGPVLTDHGQD